MDHCDQEFNKVWDMATAATASLRPEIPKQTHKANMNMDEYVVMGTTGHKDSGRKTELQRLSHTTIDSGLGEMDHRFSMCNSQLPSELVAQNPESDTFLDVKHHAKHIMDLPGSPIIDDHPQPIEGDWTLHQILSKYHTSI